jgi:iron complex transport system ATP-binding protein
MPRAIELHNVYAGYASQETVLEDVTLSVGSGDFTAVVGPNGSGKTTLLRVVAGALKAHVGRVLIWGKEMRLWSRRRLAQEIAVVPQMTLPPFAFTVYEYVSLGRNPYLAPWASPRPADREAIRRAMELAKVEAIADKRVTELSGGEFQRANLARALAQEPQILLLDEPTAFLDPAHTVSVLGVVEDLNAQGLTVVAVFHELNLAAMYSRRVVAMRAGRIFADGAVDEVLCKSVLEDLYGTPVLVDKGPLGKPRITLLKTRAHAEA